MLEAFREYRLGMENVAWFHNRMICYLYLHTWLVKIALQSQILMNSFAVIVELLSHVWLFCNPMVCSPPGSSVHGILQARILEWVTIPFSRGSSWPRDWTQVSWRGRPMPYHWATNFSEQYFFQLVFFFNWSIVDLQFCISFIYTAEWFSYASVSVFQILFHYSLLQDPEYSSLCYICIVGPYCLFILYIRVCV